jgi:hypothetical protein
MLVLRRAAVRHPVEYRVLRNCPDCPGGISLGLIGFVLGSFFGIIVVFGRKTREIGFVF